MGDLPKQILRGVVASLGISVGVAVIFFLITPKVSSHGTFAKPAAATLDEAELAASLKQFKADCGRYPNEREGLAALIVAPSELKGKAREPYFWKTTIPVDPWGNPYAYRLKQNGDGFVVSSYGRDGLPGGSGEDSDIVLEE